MACPRRPMVPSDAGYVDLTGVNPYNPEKGWALLKEAGGQTLAAERDADAAAAGLCEKGGEIIASQLAKVGVVAKIPRTSSRRSGSGTFKGNFDLTVIVRRAARLRPLRRRSSTAAARGLCATCSRPTTPAPTARAG